MRHAAPIGLLITFALSLGAAMARAQAPGANAGEIDEFPVSLARFTTSLLGSTQARLANIRLATDALEGRVLEVGEVLSFNAAVGPRTLERGFQMAPAILHEERQVQIGGGICQPASNLLVAGLLAGLSVVERWRHSSAVDYVALGHDATIAWGAKDLRLRNDLEQRVRLRFQLTGATLTAEVQGEVASGVHYELVTAERESPADLGVADAAPGREIELYRVVLQDGEETARELVLRDIYPPTRGRRRE